MSFRRDREQNEKWQAWLGLHQEELVECGVPSRAWHTELDWFLFLDHGYVQVADENLVNWWNVNFLTRRQAEALVLFIEREYNEQYSALVWSLRQNGKDPGSSDRI